MGHAGRRSVLAVVLAAVSVHVSAALVDHGSFTEDTATGLDWLDLTQTQRQSVNAAQTGAFAAAGWQVATDTQVRALFVRYIGGAPQFYSGALFAPAVETARLLGVNFSTNDPEGTDVLNGPNLPVQWQTAGYFIDYSRQPFMAVSYGMGQVSVNFDSAIYPSPNGDAGAWFVDAGTQRPDVPYQWGGVFMVRASSVVPEPGSFLLALAGLLILPAVRAERKGAAK